MNPQVVMFLWNKRKKSRGIRRGFYTLVLLVLGLGSGMGYPKVKALLTKAAPGVEKRLEAEGLIKPNEGGPSWSLGPKGSPRGR